MPYWILQSNPSKFRIIDWLKDFNWCSDSNLIDCWHISQFKREIADGDVVFIWKSKGNEVLRGIYAKAEIVSKPTKFLLEEREREYDLNIDEMKRLEGLHKIALRYKKIYLDAPLFEEEIKHYPSLRNLSIFNNPIRGIHKVDQISGEIIEQLLGKHTSNYELSN